MPITKKKANTNDRQILVSQRGRQRHAQACNPQDVFYSTRNESFYQGTRGHGKVSQTSVLYSEGKLLMPHVTTQDRVVVRPDETNNQTASGLIIPEFEAPRNKTGVVVAVGPGRLTKKNVVVAVAVAPGDRVMFDSGAGVSVRTDGEDLIILKEDEIIGVVADE